MLLLRCELYIRMRPYAARAAIKYRSFPLTLREKRIRSSEKPKRASRKGGHAYEFGPSQHSISVRAIQYFSSFYSPKYEIFQFVNILLFFLNIYKFSFSLTDYWMDRGFDSINHSYRFFAELVDSRAPCE